MTHQVLQGPTWPGFCLFLSSSLLPMILWPHCPSFISLISQAFFHWNICSCSFLCLEHFTRIFVWLVLWSFSAQQKCFFLRKFFPDYSARVGLSHWPLHTQSHHSVLLAAVKSSCLYICLYYQFLFLTELMLQKRRDLSIIYYYFPSIKKAHCKC